MTKERSTDVLVAVHDTTVPLFQGKVSIGSEEHISSKSLGLAKGEFVKVADLVPSFVDSIESEDVLKRYTAEEFAKLEDVAPQKAEDTTPHNVFDGSDGASRELGNEGGSLGLVAEMLAPEEPQDNAPPAVEERKARTSRSSKEVEASGATE
jgi:hypothetical protein